MTETINLLDEPINKGSFAAAAAALAVATTGCAASSQETVPFQLCFQLNHLMRLTREHTLQSKPGEQDHVSKKHSGERIPKNK